jgi:hypothetical protein
MLTFFLKIGHYNDPGSLIMNHVEYPRLMGFFKYYLLADWSMIIILLLHFIIYFISDNGLKIIKLFTIQEAKMK